MFVALIMKAVFVKMNNMLGREGGYNRLHKKDVHSHPSLWKVMFLSTELRHFINAGSSDCDTPAHLIATDISVIISCAHRESVYSSELWNFI